MPDLPTYSNQSGRTIGPDEIAARTFPNARKGLDADAVHRFLSEVADQVRDLRLERDDLRRRLADAIEAAQSAAQVPAVVELDESALAAIVGTETGRVLQVAHEAAHDLVTKAEQRASELVAGAQSLVSDRRTQAENEAVALLGSARDEAEAIHERAKESGRAMVQEAREARRRILADLAERRRSLHLQLEQIRVGKESLVEVVEAVAATVASSIDSVRARLLGADDEARDAAEGVGLPELADEDALEDLVSDALVNLPPAAEADGAGADGAGGENSDPSDGTVGESAPDASPVVSAIFDVERPDQVVVPSRLPPVLGAAIAGAPRVADLSVTEISGGVPVGEAETDRPTAADATTPAADARQREHPGGANDANSAGPATGAISTADGEASPNVASAADAPGGVGDGGTSESPAADGPAADDQAGPVTEATQAKASEDAAVIVEASSALEGPGPDPAGSTTEEGLDSTTASVDALFAKIRASRASDVADAHRVLDAGAAEDPATSGEETIPDRRRSSGARRSTPLVAVVTEVAVTEDEGSSENSGGQTVPADEPVADEGASVRLDGESSLEVRAVMIAPAAAELSRSLKRALRMEQNDLLDELRHLAKNAKPHDLLPGEAAAKRLVESVYSGISLAYGAGARFYAEVLDAPAPSAAVPSGPARSIASELAEEVRSTLHRRLEPGLSAPGDGDDDYPAVVNAAFRDWKGTRVEGLAGDYVTRAFAQAVVDRSKTEHGRLIWVVDDGDTKCPDCDDNAVAGAQAAGTEFPTGHLLPPVHPGCRCVLVPVRS